MFEYWYNNNPQEKFRHHPLDILNLRYLKSDYGSSGTFKEECIKTAIEIDKKFPQSFIALSGGWGSQIIFQSFIEAGLRPNVFIIEFPFKLNVVDSYYAKQACKSAGIIPEVFHPELKEIAENESVDFAKKYQLYNFFDVLLAKYAEQVKSHVILGNQIELRRDVNPSTKWSLCLNETQWADRFSSINNTSIVDDFFLKNSNVVKTFLENSKVQDVVTNKIEGKISLNSTKKDIYQSLGFTKEHPIAKTISTNGIKKLEYTAREKIIQAIGYHEGRNMYIEFEELVSSLNEEEKVWKFV